MLSFYEFFAGGGMARAGLGPAWNCHFANDFDFKKGEAYKNNWGDEAIKICDVRSVRTSDLPDIADLAWASFPCQDLSLAGGGAGLRGDRSGTFWPFWELVSALRQEGRAPRAIVLENVCGTLTSHNGKDFGAIADALASEQYRFGAVVVDAAYFVPHSRPRLFVIAVRDDVIIPHRLTQSGPSEPWHSKSLRLAHSRLSKGAQERWVWWNVSIPNEKPRPFSSVIESEPSGVRWHSPAETRQLLAMMSDINRKKLDHVKQSGHFTVGAIYKRTRLDADGGKIQRAEVRFDDIAGCLRTPAGGSSRQLILVVQGNDVRSRLISTRETARLMGLPDSYDLPQNYNEAYHLTGDGVVVPVVRHLSVSILEPILSKYSESSEAA